MSRDPGQFAPAASWSFGDIVILEAASMPGVYVHVGDGQVCQEVDCTPFLFCRC